MDTYGTLSGSISARLTMAQFVRDNSSDGHFDAFRVIWKEKKSRLLNYLCSFHNWSKYLRTGIAYVS